MKKRATEYYKKKLEEKRRTLFPLTILQSEKLIRLDNLLDTRNEVGLMNFWKDKTNIEIDTLRYLSNELGKRGPVSEDDKELIKNLVEDYNKHHPSFELSGSVGIFMQISEVIHNLEEHKLTMPLKVPLLFWLYLTLIESCVSDLSEMFFELAEKKGDDKFIEEFKERFDKGEHFLFSQLKRYSISWGYTSENKKTFLHKSNLRNEIAHANIWYDSSRDKILLRGRKELSFNEFLEEFERVYNFFMELMFRLNGSEVDLTRDMIKLTDKLYRMFLEISRSGPKKQKWKNDLIFDWEKEES